MARIHILSNIISYVSKMKIFFTIVLAMLVVSVCTDKILAILDNKVLEDTHGKFFEMLKKEGELEIAYSYGKNKIELKHYDKFRYDHIIVMCTSSKGIILIYVEI